MIKLDITKMDWCNKFTSEDETIIDSHLVRVCPNGYIGTDGHFFVYWPGGPTGLNHTLLVNWAVVGGLEPDVATVEDDMISVECNVHWDPIKYSIEVREDAKWDGLKTLAKSVLGTLRPKKKTLAIMVDPGLLKKFETHEGGGIVVATAGEKDPIVVMPTGGDSWFGLLMPMHDDMVSCSNKLNDTLDTMKQLMGTEQGEGNEPKSK